MKLFLWMAMLATAFAGMYTKDDGVLMIESEKEYKQLLKEGGVAIVEVYADWCGHCKNLAPEYKKAAKALKGIATVAAIDGDKNRELAGKLGVQGFPTLKLFGENKNAPTDYNGERTAKGIVDAVMKEAQSIVNKRMGGKAEKKTEKKAEKKEKKESGGGNGSGPGEGKHVIKGTEENFEKEVLNADEPVMVEFYAPWCGHCKSMTSAWASAAEQLAGEVKFVAVDATAEQSLGQQFGIRGFPTIKYFPAGKKTVDQAQDYNGGRDADAFVSHARTLFEAGGGKGTLAELTGKADWSEHCAGKRICLVAFLPHILDDNAAKRNARIETLQEAAGKVGKKSLFRFLWTESGAQPGLEGALNVGMFPALVAVSEDKKVYVPYKGAFDAQHITSFVNGLAVRVDGASPYKSAAGAIAEVKAWDGKDGQVQQVEEFSLDDLE